MQDDDKVRVCFYLDKDEKRRFHAFCAEGGVTMSLLLRDFVRRLLTGNVIMLEPLQHIDDAAAEEG